MSGLNPDTPRPTEIKLHQKSNELELAFDNGSSFRLPCEFLRVYSPSAAAAFSLGRAAGSFISPRLYGLGFPAAALAAVGFNALAMLFLMRLRRLTPGGR